MIGTPAALEPWRTQLELLDPHVRVGIGSLISRLALLVGSLRAEGGGRSDEPDGFDGLERRGSYERLLATEWLLATELPDEFLRRAAEREHLFHRLARARPAGTRRSVVLFDGGPGQLGSPRIGQMSALLMFAARAEKAGVRFGWGLIQDGALHEELSPASLLHLLAGRSVREPSESDLLGWQQRIRPPAEADDLWFVGGRSLAELQGRRGSLLLIEDVLQPIARRVRVSVARRAGLHSTSVELDLPHPTVCVRLLRDPLGAAKAARRPTVGKIDLRTNLLFSAKGAHLLGRLDTGDVWAQPIPNSPAAPAGNFVRAPLHPNERLIAAGFERRRTTLLVRVGDRLLLRETGRRGGEAGAPVSVEWTGAIPEDLGNAGRFLFPLYAHRVGTGQLRRDERFILTPQGDLVTLVGLDRLVPLARPVGAVAPVFGQIVWAAEGTPEHPGHRIQTHDGFAGSQLAEDLGDHRPLEAFFGFAGGHDHPTLRCVAAVRILPGYWRIIAGGPHGGKPIEIHHGRVVGVARDGTRGGAPALVLVEDDGHQVSLSSAVGVTLVHESRSRIVQIVSSHADARLAWLTEAGEVVVWSLDAQAALLRLVPPERA